MLCYVTAARPMTSCQQQQRRQNVTALPTNGRRSIYKIKRSIAVYNYSLAATGTHMPCGITQYYLPHSRLYPGTRFSGLGGIVGGMQG